MTPFAPPEATTLDGHLERITYHNPQNHYTVARVQADRQPRPITVVGYLPGVSPGQALRLKGQWETHPRFGQQFKILRQESECKEIPHPGRQYLQPRHDPDAQMVQGGPVRTSGEKTNSLFLHEK